MHTVVLWLLVIGALAQGAYALWRSPLPFWLPCAGAFCVALAALVDRDVTLLFGQGIVLCVLRVTKTRPSTHE